MIHVAVHKKFAIKALLLLMMMLLFIVFVCACMHAKDSHSKGIHVAD